VFWPLYWLLAVCCCCSAGRLCSYRRLLSGQHQQAPEDDALVMALQADTPVYFVTLCALGLLVVGVAAAALRLDADTPQSDNADVLLSWTPAFVCALAVLLLWAVYMLTLRFSACGAASLRPFQRLYAYSYLCCRRFDARDSSTLTAAVDDADAPPYFIGSPPLYAGSPLSFALYGLAVHAALVCALLSLYHLHSYLDDDSGTGSAAAHWGAAALFVFAAALLARCLYYAYLMRHQSSAAAAAAVRGYEVIVLGTLSMSVALAAVFALRLSHLDRRAPHETFVWLYASLTLAALLFLAASLLQWTRYDGYDGGSAAVVGGKAAKFRLGVEV